MSVLIRKAGMQTTLQGAPRSGLRHFGVPASGPCDALSMALANRLVGNQTDATALEITLNGLQLTFFESMAFAVTGGPVDIVLNKFQRPMHQTLLAEAGDTLDISPCHAGCRSYLAFSGEIEADRFLNSTSTYLPAEFGGYHGRALQEGDEINVRHNSFAEELETPQELRPYFNDRFVLQVVRGPDFKLLRSGDLLFSQSFKTTSRISRMGAQIEGEALETTINGTLESAAVFPGSVQCPPDGKPYILMADAQTTGGYPHILQVIRSDRFMLGQIRSGSTVRFVECTAEFANHAYKERMLAYSHWLRASSF